MERKFLKGDIVQHIGNEKFYDIVSDNTKFKLDGVWYDGYTYTPNYECEIQMFMRKFSDMEAKFRLKRSDETQAHLDAVQCSCSAVHVKIDEDDPKATIQELNHLYSLIPATIAHFEKESK